MRRPIFALVVGINQYRSTNISNLHGCVKDAEYLRTTLRRLSQGTAQIYFLADEDATQARILQAFETHLADNPGIRRGDPMVFYFAGKGRRLEASICGLERDVDVLLPHDCDDSILGISDFTMHALLYDLAQKKGFNITVILDTCFPCLDPRWTIGHRSDTSPPRSPDTYISWRAESAQLRGFYRSSPSNVLLAACRENQLAGDTSEGGTFTQALVVELQRTHKRTFRETCEAIELPDQNPICLGLHADEPMFAIASDFRITKLRVFVVSPSISLEFHDSDDFVQVGSKSVADLTLSSKHDGRVVIERLAGPVAVYASPTLIFPEQDSQSLALVLNKIARFSYYLDMKPRSSFWKRIFSSVRISYALPWHGHFEAIELFQLELNDQEMVLFDQEFVNLLKKDVVYLDQSAAKDGVYGLRVTNRFKRKLYPRLFYFDPGSYRIMSVTLGSGDSQSLQPGSSFIIGMDGQAWSFTPDPDGERDAGFFKLFLFTSAADVDYIQQHSALEPAGGSGSSELVSCVPPGNSVFWDTKIATVALLPSCPSQQADSWKSWLSRILSRLF
ncbi:caspase domain-containing protein [Mycena polygramma]|nr:caspase domain-containing protein [Mycena polygramma]